jgi:flagellar protein FliL
MPRAFTEAEWKPRCGTSLDAVSRQTRPPGPSMESVQESEIVLPEENGKSNRLPFILVVLAGLMVGGGVGAFVAGPAIVAKLRANPALSQAARKGGKEGSQKILRVIDNLVLNPAGSGGTRFLMITATFEVKDDAADEMLKSRDAEMRDVLLSHFSRKSVDELTDIGRRDEIKKEVLALLTSRFPAGTIKAVYFPQFVIQ